MLCSSDCRVCESRQELEPPPGVSAWPRDGKLNALEAGALPPLWSHELGAGDILRLPAQCKAVAAALTEDSSLTSFVARGALGTCSSAHLLSHHTP
jgi:hypothetical protein